MIILSKFGYYISISEIDCSKHRSFHEALELLFLYETLEFLTQSWYNCQLLIKKAVIFCFSFCILLLLELLHDQ